MLLRKCKSKADEVGKYPVLVFLLRDAVSLRKTDIIPCALPLKEGVKHIGIVLQLLKGEMIFYKKQVIKLDVIDLLRLEHSGHTGLSASGMAEDKADIRFALIEAVFLIVKIRLGYRVFFARQLHSGKGIIRRIQLILFEDVHFRHSVPQEFTGIIVGVTLLLSRKDPVFEVDFVQLLRRGDLIAYDGK